MKFDITRLWYQPKLHSLLFLLVPFSFLFSIIIKLRRWFYRAGILQTVRFKVPIIVIGNITVGGTGKTPTVIWMANFLKEKGFKPGIISRGVGSTKIKYPYIVELDDSASDVGDEAALIKKHTACPFVIGKDRVAAVQMLLQNFPCDVVISDDGLQHYRLARDIEIAIVHAERNYGNQYLLPAGPLREPISRLKDMDLILANGGFLNSQPTSFTMSLIPDSLVSLKNNQKISLDEFPQIRVHAVAGIGYPQQFFNMLEKNGFEIIPHAFKDHHVFKVEDLNFSDNLPIIMTEKDAVKCLNFANENWWFLSIKTGMNIQFEDKLINTTRYKFNKNRTKH